MNFALGYTLNLKDLFKSFNIKRLKLKASECEELIGNRHKEIIMYKIMKYCIKLVLDDIIHNNATFHLPTKKKKCILSMQATSDEQFKRARRNGKWKDVDFLASNFTGYQIAFKFMIGEVTKTKPVYVDEENKDLITKYTNDGKCYF